MAPVAMEDVSRRIGRRREGGDDRGRVPHGGGPEHVTRGVGADRRRRFRGGPHAAPGEGRQDRAGRQRGEPRDGRRTSAVLDLYHDPPSPASRGSQLKRLWLEWLRLSDVCHRTGHTNMLCSMFTNRVRTLRTCRAAGERRSGRLPWRRAPPGQGGCLPGGTPRPAWPRGGAGHSHKTYASGETERSAKILSPAPFCCEIRLSARGGFGEDFP
jgi:hypothetical protein